MSGSERRGEGRGTNGNGGIGTLIITNVSTVRSNNSCSLGGGVVFLIIATRSAIRLVLVT